MDNPSYQIESIDAFEVESPEFGEVGRIEAGADNALFNETEETELAEQLLECGDERALDRLIGTLIARSMGSSHRQAAVQQLRLILRRAAKGALPAIWGSVGNVYPPTEGSVAGMAGDLLGFELEGVGAEDQEFEVARRFVRFAGESARNIPHFQASAPPAVAARRAVGAAVLQELYEAPRQPNEDLLNLEYSFLLADDEELDYFLGRIFRSVRKAAGSVAKGVGKAAGGVAKTVGKGLSAVDKVVPISLLTSGLSWTPLGLAARAGLGAVQAAGEGRNVFQGALRSLARDPITRFYVDTGVAAARGQNILKAAEKAYKAGIGDFRKSLQLATMVAPFIPGIGTGVAAALGAATALANGERITDALIAGARSAVPGGAIAQLAFDTAVNLARGKNFGEALLNSARSRLPGGPAAQAAFDAAITLAKGKSLQDAAFAATGRLLPKSPYAADALSFVKKVASGQNIQRAALSSLGNHVLNRIERKAGPLFSKTRRRFPKAPSILAARAAKRGQAARAAALARVRRNRGRFPFREIDALEQFEAGTPEHDEVDRSESGGEEDVFGETEEMELAARLLEITDENELEGFIGALIARATGGARGAASSLPLRGLLHQAAKTALPLIGTGTGNLIAPGIGVPIGSKLAAAAGNLFGLELEGLSPEDQEFEVARRFVRFAGAGARNAARFRGGASPKFAARHALRDAARRHAPGFLRRRRPRPPQRPRGVRVGTPWADWPDYRYAAPLPITVTCHCCGAPQPALSAGDTTLGDAASGGTAHGDSDNSPPDNEPANSTEPPPQTQKETDMHDLDRTTMEMNDEADSFEFEDEYEYAGEGESLFNEEEESELAAELLEINDEAELDQFLGNLLKKARRAVGGALQSPLLRPLGGLIKGAIKKALPIAGSALGNMFVPGIGGQIGSRLASGAGSLLGLEFESLAPEDQEFEVAKRLVRMAGTAVQNAAQSADAGDPQAAARSAILAAARAHVPGLLQSQSGGSGMGRRPRSGRWFRRGGKIVLVGV